MRDLHKTLKLFSTDFAMDHCEEFDKVRSIFEYCDQHVKPFNKVHFRGGNEPFINELTNRLQEMLLERELVDAQSKKPLPKALPMLRKVMMFLLANTDVTYKYNLRDDPLFAHVLEQCPLLPKFLLVTLVWELQLDQLFYEALSYTPCWFSFQYFETATESLKHIDDPYDVLEKVEHLVCAIYISIERSQLRHFDHVDKKIIYGKLYDCSMSLLRQFYTPDAEKFKNFSKQEYFRYSGYAIRHLLKMVVFAFDVYESPEKAQPDIDIEIYEICLSICERTRKISERMKREVKEQQLKIINVLLNSLQYNVMLITIDVFMYWVEVDITPTVNLQISIGEMAYKVMERIATVRAFKHDISQVLKAIVIRPKTMEETLNDATLGEVLRNLDEPLEAHVKKLWFDELLNRTVAYGNDECLQSIKDNIKLMTVENCKLMLDFIKIDTARIKAEMDDTGDAVQANQMQIDDIADYTELNAIICLALLNFKCEDILHLLSYKTTLFGVSPTIFSQSSVDFQQRATEFLNKFVNAFDLQQFLVLCFEQPTEMWNKFFECACHNSAHITNFCDTVRRTRPFSNYYFRKLLGGAIADHTQVQKKYFPQLLCEIYFVLYYPEEKTEFLKQFINRTVNVLLEGQEFEALLPIVKMLNLIAVRGETQSHKPLNFDDVTAPVLLMTAQIMDKSRWDLITYTDVRDEVVRECIDFIQNTSKKFLPVATEKDRKWITKVIKDNYRPITQYYFQKFSLTPDQPPVNFDRFLIRLEIEDKSEAEMFLIINYVRCTMKETEWLARSERLLPHISDVMLILSGVVIETGNAKAVNNYRHCLMNYANIVTKFLLPPIENDTKKAEKLELKVLKIIAAAPQQVYDETFMNFESLLLEIIKKCAQPLNEGTVEAVRKYVGTMKDCRAKGIFLEKFQTLVTECLS